MVPGDDGEPFRLGVVEQIRVVPGAVDVVEVADQVLHRQVRRERIHVEPLVQLGSEGLVVALVHELQEVDQWAEIGVVVARLLVEHVVVGVGIVASVRVVAGALRLVQRSVIAELLGHPGVVRMLDDESECRIAAVDTERDRDRILGCESGGLQQFERDGLVDRRLGGVRPDHEVGEAVVVLAVDELVELDQPRDRGRVVVGPHRSERRVALEPDTDLLVRLTVDRDGRLDPLLVAGRRVGRQHGRVVVVVELELDRVGGLAVERADGTERAGRDDGARIVGSVVLVGDGRRVVGRGGARRHVVGGDIGRAAAGEHDQRECGGRGAAQGGSGDVEHGDDASDGGCEPAATSL